MVIFRVYVYLAEGSIKKCSINSQISQYTYLVYINFHTWHPMFRYVHNKKSHGSSAVLGPKPQKLPRPGDPGHHSHSQGFLQTKEA